MKNEIEKNEQNQNKCKKCGKIIGCDCRGKTNVCPCEIGYPAQEKHDFETPR